MLYKRRIFYLLLIWMCMALYLFNRFYLKQHSTGLLWYFFVCYFSDLLAPVVMLSIANLALSFSGRSIEKLWQALLFTLACGTFWEIGTLIRPEGAFIRRGVTFDPTDFGAYLAGGLLFWFILKIMGAFKKNRQGT